MASCFSYEKNRGRRCDICKDPKRRVFGDVNGTEVNMRIRIESLPRDTS
jgi:hypothetical protein